MQVTLTVTTDSVTVEKILKGLNGKPAVVEEAEEEETEEDEDEAPPAKKKKRGRKPKAKVVEEEAEEDEAEEDEAEAEESEEEEDEADAEEDEDEAPAKKKKLTLDKNIIPAFQAYAEKHGRPKAGKILAAYKAKSVRDLPPAKFAEIMKKLKV